MLAISYLRARYEELGIPKEAFTHWDLHIHVPQGAVPKDGPSAGVALLSALASIFTQRKVKGTIAMTGEITLRGLVLPVGGIKEKVLAAKRAGIKKVLLPKQNEKDVSEIEKEVIGSLEVQYLDRMDPIVDLVLEKKPVTDPKAFFHVPKEEKKSRSGDSNSGRWNDTAAQDSASLLVQTAHEDVWREDLGREDLR